MSQTKQKQKRKHRNYYKQIQIRKPRHIPSLKLKFSLKEFLSSTTEKHEKILATFIAIFVLIVVHAPILYFSLFPKDGLVFLGRRDMNAADVSTYVSYIEQAKQGRWLLINVLTSELQKPSIIKPSYVLIGKFAQITNMPSIVAFHIAKVVFSIPFLIFAYMLIQKLFKTSKQRLLAFFVLLTSSGLYWILGSIIFSTDVWVAESNTFLMLGESPHFILSQALMLSGILLYLKFVNEKKFVFGVLAALVLFPLAFEHSWDLVTLASVFLITGFWVGIPLIQSLVISFLIAAPLGLTWLELKQNALFAAQQTQTPTYSPSIFAWIVGFGVLVPFAVYAMKRHFSKANAVLKTLIAWTLIALFLLYIPVAFQRRFSEGLHIPLALLGTVGLIDMYFVIKRRCNARVAALLVLILAVVLTFSSIFSTYRNFPIIEQHSLENRTSRFFYISMPESNALDWIKLNTPEDAVFFSNWFYGNIIAGSTARQVYIGSEGDTVNFKQKAEKAGQFLDTKDDISAYQFLRENRIQYIFTTANDSLTAYGFKPDEKPYLEKVYDHDGVFIYKVKENY